MKKFILLIVFIIPLYTYSQNENMLELSVAGKGIVDIRSNMSYNTGMELEWQPKWNFGLNYSLRFGNYYDKGFMFQCPASLVLGLVAVACMANYDDILSAGGLVFCFIPEGISYNIPLWDNDGLRLAPYVNPLILEITQEDVGMILEVGSKLKFQLGNNAFAALDFSLQSPYKEYSINTCLGMSLGVRW